jgi:hypothetical protein
MVVVAVEGINTWCMLSLNCFKMAKLLETYPGFIWVCREMGTLMLMEVEFFWRTFGYTSHKKMYFTFGISSQGHFQELKSLIIC